MAATPPLVMQLIVDRELIKVRTRVFISSRAGRWGP